MNDDTPDDFLASFLFPKVNAGFGPVEYPMFNYEKTKTTTTTPTPKAEKWKTKARRDRFPAHGGRPVKASVPGYAKIPWLKATVSLIGLNPGGEVRYAKTAEEKKEFAFANFSTLLVCWPGLYSQDIFIVDDIDALRKALGFKKLSERIAVDEHGEEWVS